MWDFSMSSSIRQAFASHTGSSNRTADVTGAAGLPASACDANGRVAQTSVADSADPLYTYSSGSNTQTQLSVLLPKEM